MISKPVIVRGREYKCRISEMHLKLRDQQLKTIMYVCIYIHIYREKDRETAILKLHGHCKPKVYNRYSHKKGGGIQT